MKKGKPGGRDRDMLPEYDFSAAVRGKYYERFQRSSNVVVLDSDVAEAFPNSASVNAALRTLAKVRKSVPRRASISTRRPNKRMQLTKSATARRRGPRS